MLKLIVLIDVPASGRVSKGIPPSLATVLGLSWVTPNQRVSYSRGVQTSVIGLGGCGVAAPAADHCWKTVTLGNPKDESNGGRLGSCVPGSKMSSWRTIHSFGSSRMGATPTERGRGFSGCLGPSVCAPFP